MKKTSELVNYDDIKANNSIDNDKEDNFIVDFESDDNDNDDKEMPPYLLILYMVYSKIDQILESVPETRENIYKTDFFKKMKNYGSDDREIYSIYITMCLLMYYGYDDLFL